MAFLAGTKWYEPEWWKFGDKKAQVNNERYFRHAYGEMYVITHALARFVPINRYILHAYAHDDVSTGSWFVALDVKYVDEGCFAVPLGPWKLYVHDQIYREEFKCEALRY